MTTPAVDQFAGSTPVARVTFVDAGDLYVSWTWEHAEAFPRLTRFTRSTVQPTLTRLAEQLPSSLPGEAVEQALDRALVRGALVDLDREVALGSALTTSLVPGRLAEELNILVGRGLRPHLRIQPSLSVAQVPWEFLVTSGTERLVDLVDVSILTPASLRNARRRTVSAWDEEGQVVLTLDPTVPGAQVSGLGSVLGPITSDSPLATMVNALRGRACPAATGSSAFARTDVTRDWLAQALLGAARWLYVGHVSVSDTALDTRLHLADGPESSGHAALLNGHRPLTATDLVVGHRAGGSGWRIPNRVALVACDSGADARFAEPTGLVAALVHNGAEFVTSTRWTLPTDLGLARYLTESTTTDGMLSDAVIAINAAHENPNPVAALARWQCAQAHRWSTTGDPRFSPVIWAAFQTTWAPTPSLVPEQLD